MVIFVIPAIIITLCSVIIVCIIWNKSAAIQSSGYRSIDSNETPRRRGVGGSIMTRGAAAVALTSNSSSTSATSSRRTIMSSSGAMGGVIPQAKIRTVKMTCVIVLGSYQQMYCRLHSASFYRCSPNAAHRETEKSIASSSRTLVYLLQQRGEIIELNANNFLFSDVLGCAAQNIFRHLFICL